jgi:hypothetical protein
MLIAVIVEQEEKAIGGERSSKHVSVAKNKKAKKDEVLKRCFLFDPIVVKQ